MKRNRESVMGWLLLGIIIFSLALLVWTIWALTVDRCREAFREILGKRRGACVYDAMKKTMHEEYRVQACRVARGCRHLLQKGDLNDSEMRACVQPRLNWNDSNQRLWEQQVEAVMKICPRRETAPIMPSGSDSSGGCGMFHPVLCLFQK